MLDKVPILRISKQGRSKTKDTVVVEHTLTIILNNQELVSLLCSPQKLEYLAIGFLFSEGLIESKDDISKVALNEKQGVIEIATTAPGKFPKETISKRLIASSGGRGISSYALDQQKNKIESQLTISPFEVFNLLEEFVHRSEIFEATGGVHSAALSDTNNILVFSEDIGRHNAIDKVFGECLVKLIPTNDRIIITSGRVSSEIVHKVAKRNIPVLISKSAPTNKGVELAADLGITLIGFAREGRMNVYTHKWRVVPHGK